MQCSPCDQGTACDARVVVQRLGPIERTALREMPVGPKVACLHGFYLLLLLLLLLQLLQSSEYALRKGTEQHRLPFEMPRSRFKVALSSDRSFCARSYPRSHKVGSRARLVSVQRGTRGDDAKGRSHNHANHCRSVCVDIYRKCRCLSTPCLCPVCPLTRILWHPPTLELT